MGDISIRQIQTMINGQLYLCGIKIWPMSLVNHLKKLSTNFELVVYTILPRETINQIYALIPCVYELISHTICNEDIKAFQCCATHRNHLPHLKGYQNTARVVR